MSGVSWDDAAKLAEATTREQEARRSALAEREAAQYADDPFPLTPPSPAEQERVASEAALLTAAADKVERLVADGPPLPLEFHTFDAVGGPAADVLHPFPGHPGVQTGLTRVAMLGTQDAATAELIVVLVNAGSDLVALLRDLARDAVEVGPNPWAVALARKIMGEGER